MELRSHFAIVVFTLMHLVCTGQKDQFANNLKSCVASNPDINVCLLKTLEDLRSLMPVGIPELNLRPTEPFQINNLKFKTRPGLGISIDSTFTDVRMYRLVVAAAAAGKVGLTIGFCLGLCGSVCVREREERVSCQICQRLFGASSGQCYKMTMASFALF